MYFVVDLHPHERDQQVVLLSPTRASVGERTRIDPRRLCAIVSHFEALEITGRGKLSSASLHYYKWCRTTRRGSVVRVLDVVLLPADLLEDDGLRTPPGARGGAGQLI